MTEPSVTAVVVTYYPDQGLACRLEALVGQVDRIVIVDNTGDAGRLLHPPHAIECEVLTNPRNLGIGAALNNALNRTAELGHTHALLLDQDTLVDRGIVHMLLQGFGKPLDRPAAIVGANSRSPAGGRVVFPTRSHARFDEVRAVVTSGSLLRLDAFRETGPFREDLFIEGVDTEYCLRLRRQGYSVLRSVRPLMTHAGGTGRERILLGRRILLGDHEPWRYYLMTRNLVLILREYARREPAWAARSVANLAKLSVKVALLEDEPARKLGSLAAGIRDGALGRLDHAQTH